MKKSVIIIAVAFGFMVSSTYATTSFKTIDNFRTVKVNTSVNPFCVAIAQGDIETVQKLIELGADVNERSNGMTPLMYAAKYNRVAIIKLLVANGADLNRKSEDGLSAANYAERSNAQDAMAVIEDLDKA